jgi:FG-GAP repeat
MRRWLAALLPLLVLALTAEPALARDVTTSSDFNGDGFADLAVGVPIEGVGSLGEAGAVNVIYGGPHGLSAARDQFWDQDSPGSGTPRRRATASVRLSPRGTLTATASTISPSASPVRTSTRPRTRAP